MPEWNLVVAQKTKRAFIPLITIGLTMLANRSAVICCLFSVALVLTTQTGCTKLRGGGLDGNILRSGSNTIPSQQSQPVSATGRFSNNPKEALLELNDAYEKFEDGSTSATELIKPELEKVFDDINPSQLQRSDAKIVEVSRQSFDTQQRGVKLVAVQPPAPSIKHSFEAVQGSSSVNADRVLLGGGPLSEIKPVDPAQTLQQYDDDHSERHSHRLTEQLEPQLPVAKPVQPPAISLLTPPSELVSQPLAPIMFDETTRKVQAYDQQHTNGNALRDLRQELAEKPAPLEEKNETQFVSQPTKIVHAQSTPMEFFPVVDPDLGRAIKSPPTCSECDSLRCNGECIASMQNTQRRSDFNGLRPVVASEQIPFVAIQKIEATVGDSLPKRAPIKIKGEFVPAPKALPLSKVDYSELSTQDWTEIFGPTEVPGKVEAQIQPKQRRLELHPKLQDVPSPVHQVVVDASVGQFQPPVSNDVLPIKQNVKLVGAEVVADDVRWEPPKHTNFSPIPIASGSPEPAPLSTLAKAAVGGNDTLFPVVDTHVEVPLKPEVIVEIIDNTVPWSVKLAQTIDNVRGQLEAEHDASTRNGIEVNLRLLEVLQRQMGCPIANFSTGNINSTRSL